MHNLEVKEKFNAQKLSVRLPMIRPLVAPLKSSMEV